MSSFKQTPKFLLRLFHFPPRLLYALGLGPLVGNILLLLTTTGRKTGKRRVTPLQYEEIDGVIYLGAALGPQADWYRNIQADPHVEVRLKSRCIQGLAETITDPKQIADFLEVRYRRHPGMVGAILRAEGIKLPPERQSLEQYAKQLTLVGIRPDKASQKP